MAFYIATETDSNNTILHKDTNFYPLSFAALLFGIKSSVIWGQSVMRWELIKQIVPWLRPFHASSFSGKGSWVSGLLSWSAFPL